MVVNLTPHAITIRIAGVPDLDIPASGKVARVTQTSEEVGHIANPTAEVDVYRDGLGNAPWIPVTRNTMGTLIGLPDPSDGTVYLVSLIALQCVDPARSDVFAPATGPTDDCIRDASGKIVAVTRLVRR